ncbi:MAG: hypothetical protein AAFV29_22195, partial [Myxococcota bacterium]
GARGPAGPIGATGDDGPQGPPGPRGLPGVPCNNCVDDASIANRRVRVTVSCDSPGQRSAYGWSFLAPGELSYVQCRVAAPADVVPGSAVLALVYRTVRGTVTQNIRVDVGVHQLRARPTNLSLTTGDVTYSDAVTERLWEIDTDRLLPPAARLVTARAYVTNQVGVLTEIMGMYLEYTAER